MPRPPNAVDFWRGFALITIFIDHIPGLYYSHYTLGNYSTSDAAELFVFLAGWSLRLLADGGGRHTPTRDIMLRLFGRALELYAAQVLITVLAIAMLAATSTEFNNPLLLEWNNAAAVFNDPVPTHIGLAVLTHQLGFFDILPLYVVLMLMAPLFTFIDRAAQMLLLPLSGGLYVAALAFRLTLPTWPVSGTWFFNPLAWQFVFVLGFSLAKGDTGIGALVRRHIVGVRLVGLPIVVLGALVVVFDWWPDPTKVPNPKLFFIADKTYVTPIRLVQFLAQVGVFSLAFPYIQRAADWPPVKYPLGSLIGMLAMLGRNSLYVFCMGSLLSLAGQIGRFYYRGGIGIDTAVVISGIIIMAFTAWLAEIATARTTCLGAALGVALIGAQFVLAPAWAQSPPSAPAAVPDNVTPPVSKACQTGTAGTADQSPLPNVMAALAQRKRLRILAMGAAPGRVNAHGGYTAEIETMLGRALKDIDVAVINRGVSGELAADAAIRMKNEVALEEPDLVLWQVGTNDALAYVPVDEFTDAVKRQIEWLKEHKVDVVLVGLQFAHQVLRDRHYSEIRDSVRKLAAQENVIVIRFFEAMQVLNQAAATATEPPADEFERTEFGYNCLAQYVAQAITLGVFAKRMPRRP